MGPVALVVGVAVNVAAAQVVVHVVVFCAVLAAMQTKGDSINPSGDTVPTQYY